MGTGVSDSLGWAGRRIPSSLQPFPHPQPCVSAAFPAFVPRDPRLAHFFLLPAVVLQRARHIQPRSEPSVGTREAFTRGIHTALAACVGRDGVGMYVRSGFFSIRVHGTLPPTLSHPPPSLPQKYLCLTKRIFLTPRPVLHPSIMRWSAPPNPRLQPMPPAPFSHRAERFQTHRPSWNAVIAAQRTGWDVGMLQRGWGVGRHGAESRAHTPLPSYVQTHF
ncbi:hypothetical protein M427DRAFT_233890 [Gonapodya prolifera JEL478]|uniref:Uncharacterized protein n=1 Tax=Gonapodya prolifera (strain JEL478) TaxID=1344416 RepID=A0A139AM38_GONPJ|nr:hypothetical protein M427DRAFT_233890 [Gonapodya prolifera JEL478]|eukprot:KXS17850.1 hypothetical protein M427DRAFT_233890 [Gonapodya prolifera JEL478]